MKKWMLVKMIKVINNMIRWIEVIIMRRLLNGDMIIIFKKEAILYKGDIKWMKKAFKEIAYNNFKIYIILVKSLLIG